MAGSIGSSFTSWPRSISLDAAGLVALADLDTVAKRTVLTGTSDLLDSFIICPGLHRQQEAVSLNNGETPSMAAMLTGYICRVENPATVCFLQRIAQTGVLTTVKVEKRARVGLPMGTAFHRLGIALISCPSVKATLAYLATVLLSGGVLLSLILLRSWSGLGAIGALMFSRLCNTIVIRRRSVPRWHGALEPGLQADNLILLAQDRWVRMQGSLDDVKAVTSGQWLREPTFFEQGITSLATVVVYTTAALASNVDGIGKVMILLLLLMSVGLLSIANEVTNTLSMHGRTISVQGPREPFNRRLQMVMSLVSETGRDDWAMRMGLVVRNDNCHSVTKDLPAPSGKV